MNNKDAKIVYADIIDMERPVSKKRPRMSASHRAAQFAPFAALTGFEDMVDDSFERSEKEPGL